MPSEIFLLKKFEHTAENIAFSDLSRNLQTLHLVIYQEIYKTQMNNFY